MGRLQHVEGAVYRKILDENLPSSRIIKVGRWVFQQDNITKATKGQLKKSYSGLAKSNSLTLGARLHSYLLLPSPYCWRKVQSLAATWNQTLSNATSQWSGSGIYCETSIDGIGTCWPRSSAGQLVARPCPEMFYGVRYNTTNNVYRRCLANGTWALKGNYSMCKAILHEEKKSKMHYQIAVIINFLGHCISMVALLIAFFLFLCLRCKATNLCLRSSYDSGPSIWCRLVTASFNYFHSTNFFWMFGEGCYLHTAIVLTYSTDKLRKWMFICIGWCIPFPIIVAWAIGKLYYDNEKCWFGKRAGVYTDYIYQGPMILVLVVRVSFFALQYFCKKLCNPRSTRSLLFSLIDVIVACSVPPLSLPWAFHTSEPVRHGCLIWGFFACRKAVKATLVLLPLLGITYMLFFVNPGEDEISQIVFIYFNSFLESFQGFFVSVFYCFLNSEVRSAVRKRFHRWQEQHSIRARMTQAMSIPTSPSRVSFHSIKQSTSL
ncbi:corticotropin-releasing factor receptor 1-like [Neolamprologus brichardi]|uniref:corticotropin-releasing factor receptor 1-like n=1 Tax=Neolamprologus brichardi TaxID=32507 RepID=UPI001643B7B6|nr:corticotropin-releasing factor receptor 1-like [Neolamprologus brichardi]